MSAFLFNPYPILGVSNVPEESFIRRNISRSVRALPPLPNVVTLVLDETNKPEPSAAKVESVIATDQAMTSQLLRLVNSAYYGLSGNVNNVGQAIVIAGLHQVRNLVLSLGALSAFQPKTPRQQQTIHQFWMHSFFAASAARSISQVKRLPGKDGELMFVGGLLHDIGRLFLFTNFQDAYDQVLNDAKKKGVSVEQAEMNLLQVNHAEIGREITTMWKLPESLCHIIGRHEGPFDESDTPSTLGVHIADCLAKEQYFGENQEQPWEFHATAGSWLGFTDAQILQVKEVAAIKTAEAMQMLGNAA